MKCYLTLFASLAGALASACVNTDNEASNEDVLIGVLLPLTGQLASTGINHERAMRMAVDDINALGGVGGRKLRLVVRDTEEDPNRAAEVVRELVDEVGVQAVIGPVEPEIASKTLWFTAPRKIAQVLPSIQPRNLRPATDLRIAPSTEALACAMANRIYATDGLDRADVFYQEGLFGAQFAETFVSIFQRLTSRGSAGVADSLSYTADQYSYAGSLQTLADRLAKAVVLEGDAKATANVIQNWAAEGIGLKWYLGPFLDSDVFLANVPRNSLDGTLGLATSHPQYSAGFREAYESAWLGDVPLSSSVHYYDAVIIVALAQEVRLARGKPLTERTLMAEEIKGVVETPGTKVPWTQLSLALDLAREGADLEFTGVSGPIELTSRSVDEELKSIRFFEIVDHRVVYDDSTASAATVCENTL